MSDHDEEQYAGGHLIGISACFVVLDTLFIVARLVSRKSLRKVPWGMDDILAIAGYFACIAMSAVAFCFVIYANVGYHEQEAIELNPNAMVAWAKLIVTLEVVYTAAVSFTKLSILCLFYRIFTTKPYRIAIVSLIVLVVLVWLGVVLAGILECIPTDSFWDKSKPGKCFNTEAYFRWGPFPGAVVDVFMLALPIVAVWRLQASRGRKLELTLMFLLGGLGLLACVARITLFWLRSAYDDPTYASWFLVGINVIEPSFYLFACCLVTMKPLAQYIFEVLIPDRWQSAIRTLLGSKSASSGRSAGKRDACNRTDRPKRQREPKASWSEARLIGVPHSYLVQATSEYDQGRGPPDDDVIEMRRDVLVEGMTMAKKHNHS